MNLDEVINQGGNELSLRWLAHEHSKEEDRSEELGDPALEFELGSQITSGMGVAQNVS